MDGFLPKIKCSSCGVDIDISQLADHVCATNASSSPELRSPQMERSGTFGGPSFSKRSEGQRQSSGRMPPPARIDPFAANKPFRPMDPSPVSDYSNGLPSGGRSPYQAVRSATSPMPRSYGMPSPDLSSNMDNPFPPFPKRGATPRSAKPQPVERSETLYSQKYAEPSPLFAPLSPNINGGERIAKRMDTIRPGPFDGREDRRPSTSSGPRTPAQEQKPMGHRRTATQSSVRSNGVTRASLASTMSHGSTYSNGSIGLPANPRPGMGGVPPVPLKRQPSKTEGIDAFLDRLQKESMSSSPRGPRPRQSPTRQENSERRTPPPRPRRPSEADQGRQDSSTGGYSVFAPRSNNMFPSGGTSRNESNSAIRRNDLPLPSYGNQQAQNSLHTPSDSGQSDDSYTSGFRSVASSRSSPPQSEAAHSRQVSKVGRSDYLGEEPIQRTASPETYEDRRPPPSQVQSRFGGGSYARRNAPEPARTYDDIPESPMDPAIQMGMARDKRPTEPALRREPSAPLSRNPPRSVTEPDRRDLDRRQPQSRRPPGGTKGICRGCEQPIYGKSVKDSSGRLTGRYHKECFVCKTCSDPFPTADFYVFENSPYCEHHYHELNGSLCQSCNRGIEGQYLETDVREKFHPRCFTCSTCRIVLRDDYYEVGRNVYCERHAYAVMSQQKSSLGPGGNRTRNLQKRRTRMMMMG